MHTHRYIFVVLTLLVPASQAARGTDSFPIRHAARAVSDAFMRDLAAHRIPTVIGQFEGSRLQPMEPESVRDAYIQNLFNVCGQPLNPRIENNGVPVVGEENIGRQKHTTLTFLYSYQTSHQSKSPKHTLQFHVEVALSEDGKYYVTAFGCPKEGVPLVGRRQL